MNEQMQSFEYLPFTRYVKTKLLNSEVTNDYNLHMIEFICKTN
jgi:hypothetical protein